MFANRGVGDLLIVYFIFNQEMRPIGRWPEDQGAIVFPDRHVEHDVQVTAPGRYVVELTRAEDGKTFRFGRIVGNPADAATIEKNREEIAMLRKECLTQLEADISDLLCQEGLDENDCTLEYVANSTGEVVKFDVVVKPGTIYRTGLGGDKNYAGMVRVITELVGSAGLCVFHVNCVPVRGKLIPQTA